MSDIKPVEIIEAGSRQLKEAISPPQIVEKEGKKRFSRTHEYYDVLTKAWKDEALTWEEVQYFLPKAEEHLAVLEAIPSRFTFSMAEGEEGAKARTESLNEILTAVGIKPVTIEGNKYSPAEIWDAVYYQATEEKDKKNYPYLIDIKGREIRQKSSRICQVVDKEQQRTILAFNDGFLAEDIDPRSFTSGKLLARDGVNCVRLNKKQKERKTGKIQAKNTLVLRAKLDRYDVITAFLNQRAEGRSGQEEAPKPGDSQLPGMISYQEGRKTLQIQGLSEDEANGLIRILEDVDAFKEKHKDELLGGFQGRKGWIAEATLRRMHEIWKETSDDFQKNVGDLMTWTSELGHGCLVSEWLDIPGVAEVLTWPEWYQQREPVTDKPLPMKPIEEIEATVKQRARNLDIPTSKVDLALFLSEILQLGYWTGRVGWKTRHPGEKYGYLDIGGGLPVWSWENFVDKSDLTPEQKAVFTPEKRKVFEFQLAELNAFVVGMAMTSYSTEHLGRIPDEASQEDLLFLTEVGEPPIYSIPDDAIIRVIADLDMIPFKEMKQNFQYSYLHQQQLRWQFVYAYYYKDKEGRRLLPQFASPIGEEAVEKQYINPENPDHRRKLIEFLQNPNFTAVITLKEAGLNPQLITDAVIQALFSDQNMLAVNQNRRDFYDQQHREVALIDLVNFSRSASTEQDLAMILELVLRDKRTWGLDMGKNNSFINDPQLPREIRERGGFSADQVGLMVTAEYNRKYHVATLSKFLEIMARAHLRNEFYSAKQIVEELSTMYGDIARTRANSLVNPWTILETAASIRASMMLIGYWDAGYAHTGGRMVTDQETLFDQLDIDRLFHERFYPVIGAAQRVRKGHEGYIKWMKDICLRQRARLSMSLARFFERQFYSQMAPLNGIIEIRRGEGGKHIYVHGVPVYRNGKQDIVFPEDSDYYAAMENRFAEMFYFPASRNQLEQMNAAAKQKQLDEDHARQQIDQLVGLGFMRRWENDKGQKVGLGDLFKVKFEINGQEHVYPIEFMMNLGQNVRSIAADYAVAKGFTISGYSPGISSRYFWDIAKTNPDKLDANGKQIWEDFCKMMIEGWLVDPSMPDSMMPQFYWEWREMTQAALGIPEEGIHGLGERLRLAYEGGKDVVVGQALKLFNKEGSIWQKALAKPGLRGNMKDRWQADPIPGALKEIKKNFCDKIVFDFVTQLKNAEKEGTFLRDKVGYRQQIKNAFLADHIDERTYDVLNNLVVNASYRPNILKNWNNPDYLVHKKWPTLQGFVTEKVAEMFAKMGEKDIKNDLTAQWIFTYLNANPLGYGIGLTIAGLGGGIFAITTSAAPLMVGLGILGGIQVSVMVVSGIIRGIDYGVRKATKGRHGFLGTSADSLIFEAEYTGVK